MKMILVEAMLHILIIKKKGDNYNISEWDILVSLSKHYKTLGKKDDLVGLKVYDKSNDEFVYIKNVDSGIFAGKNKNDELGHNYTMSDLMVQTMENGGYMAKGGKTPIVRTQFEEEEFEYADGGEFKGYKADKKEKFTYTLTGEELRKFKYRSFSEQIENARKFKELIEKVYEAQPEGDIYPIEFIKAQARTTFSMGKDDKGKIYVLGTYGRGSFTHFPFLNDKNFIEALKYVDRPAIRKFMADGGMLDEDEAKARKAIVRDRNRLVQMNVGKDDKSLNFAIKLIDMLLDGELDKTMAKGGSIQDVEKYIADKYFYGDMRGFSVNKDNKGNYELYIDNIEAFEAEYGEEKAYEIETDINSIYAKRRLHG